MAIPQGEKCLDNGLQRLQKRLTVIKTRYNDIVVNFFAIQPVCILLVSELTYNRA